MRTRIEPGAEMLGEALVVLVMVGLAVAAMAVGMWVMT